MTNANSVYNSHSANANGPGLGLAERHRRELVEGSAINPDVIAERGVRTVHKPRQLPEVFSKRQRRRAPGMLFTVHRPKAEISYCFKPDNIDPKNPGCKYEMPSKHYGGPGNVLDVHPSTRRLIDDPSVPVLFVEGIKKGDSLTSAFRAAGVKVLVVAIPGVWNWLSDGEPIPDLFDIPMEGRRATIMFDSDMLRNPSVQQAAGGLAEHLTARGARVFITYLNDASDGSKQGPDDFLVSGGTLRELRMLTRPYNPEDFITVRLSRDERLRLALQEIVARWWAFPWKGKRAYSVRDVVWALIEEAYSHGKPVDDGVRVRLSHGTLGLRAKIHRPETLCRAIEAMEEMGFGYRDNANRKPGECGAFVLSAKPEYVWTGRDAKEKEREKVTEEYQTLYHPTTVPRLPRLMWSSPGSKPRPRGVISDTRRVRQANPPEPRPPIKRPGKISGAVLDVVSAVDGGACSWRDVARILGHKRPWDLRRRYLPVLEEAGVLAEETSNAETLSDRRPVLAEDWEKKLARLREAGGEIEAEDLARRRLVIKREAFHSRHRHRPDRAPSEDELKARRERFKDVLAAKRQAQFDRMRDAALEAFRHEGSGARKNLELFFEGRLANIECLVKSVLRWYRPHDRHPFRNWKDWTEAVKAAGLQLARERAPDPASSDETEPHRLDCECRECIYPKPRYARPYQSLRGVA